MTVVDRFLLYVIFELNFKAVFEITKFNPIINLPPGYVPCEKGISCCSKLDYMGTAWQKGLLVKF